MIRIKFKNSKESTQISRKMAFTIKLRLEEVKMKLMKAQAVNISRKSQRDYGKI